jgi:hypothetical protein
MEPAAGAQCGLVLGEVVLELLFGAQEVGVVVVAGFDRDPVDAAGEVGTVVVVGHDARAGVLADVGGLVGGEADRDGVVEASGGAWLPST